MHTTRQRTTVMVLVIVPAGLLALMIGSNVLLAAAAARIFAAVGAGPAGGAGFWALYFGALGLANLPALAAFGRWAQAEGREQAARAEVLGAVRWAAHLDRWQPQLWPGVPAPLAAGAPGLDPLDGPALRRQMPHAALFLAALLTPVALAGLLAAG